LTYEIANPDPAGTIASLSALGYSVEAAVADLIDNSIAAAARRIEVTFEWSGRDSWVAVVDNGTGMDRDELVRAMTIAGRGPATPREAHDLGRFGMGLKTASFSQARTMSVVSRRAGGGWSAFTWDLDTVEHTGEWRLLHGPDAADDPVVARLLEGRHHGTVVVWRRLHRFIGGDVTVDTRRVQEQFYAEVARVEAHLGMVFGRYVQRRDRVALVLNGNPVTAWDPFLTAHPSTQRLPQEHLPVDGRYIRVEGFVLPHPRRMSETEASAAAGPNGWLDQQGFYLYRRDRLILAGDWLGLRGLRRDEKHNLARIAVDVPAELDDAWRLDVRKSTAVPPVAIRSHLLRIAGAARRTAAQVISHRGQMVARAHAADFVYAWRVQRHDGRITCRINRDHPLVRQVLRTAASGVDDARALIRLLEETVPVATLRIMHETDTVDDPEPFEEATDAQTLDVAERIYSALISQGCSPSEAKRRLSLMPPFDQLKGFWRS